MDVLELERVMDQCLLEALEKGSDPLEALTDCIDHWLAKVAMEARLREQNRAEN